MQERCVSEVCGSALLKRKPIRHMESHLRILTLAESTCVVCFFLYCILYILL